MRVVLQRVAEAQLTVEGCFHARIGPGLVLLVGIGKEDESGHVDAMAQKCLSLRVFEDDQGKMNRSVSDLAGDILVISQFTLYGDTRRGRRPGFSDAADPLKAETLYDRFVAHLRRTGLNVHTGVFGARMLVQIHNDGPVTFVLESPAPNTRADPQKEPR